MPALMCDHRTYLLGFQKIRVMDICMYTYKISHIGPIASYCYVCTSMTYSLYSLL